MRSQRGPTDGAPCCAIDFGTSNSAVALAVGDPNDGRHTRIELAPLEQGATSMPTAVFYSADDGSRRFGRAAIAAARPTFQSYAPVKPRMAESIGARTFWRTTDCTWRAPTSTGR